MKYLFEKRGGKEMKINERYILVFEVDGRPLTYTGKIISEDEMFVTFIDKFGKTISYNKSNIISFEEVKG